MAYYTITNDCIGCQRCLSACPTGAIATDGNAFWIETDLCNQCEGSYGIPQCWAVCPTNEGCVPLTVETVTASLNSKSETSTDYWEFWSAKYVRMLARLKDSKQPRYWRQWFDAYSQTLRNLQAQPDRESKQSRYWQQWFDTYARALQNLQATSGDETSVPSML